MPRPSADLRRWVAPGLRPSPGGGDSDGDGGGNGVLRGTLRHDLVAGLALSALVVPQGMAYASLAGLSPETGLYATLVALVAYAAVGPSRVLVIGPDSALTLLVAAALAPLAAAPTDRAGLAAMLALLTGAYALAGGAARLGFLADLISKPVRIGFMAGIAATVTGGQLPRLLGFTARGDELWDELRALAQELDRTRPGAVVAGGATAIAIVALRRWAPRAPGVLVAVVGVTAVVGAFDLARWMPVVGSVPSGLPGLALPSASGHLLRLLADAVGIALVAVADTVVLSRAYASRRSEPVDPNREMAALGVVNLAAGLFHGFPVSGSSSRTPVAEAAGARTQLASLTAAGGVAVVLAVATGAIAKLPVAALAAILIIAVARLVEPRELRHLARANPLDFWLAVASFGGVVWLGVLDGIAVAVGLSAAAFFWRAWHPHEAVLGRVTGLKGYHDLERHPEALQVPGLVVFRFDAPLFFANAGVFQQEALRAVGHASPRALRLVVAAEPITDVDSTAADMLLELHDDLAQAGVELAFAELKDPVLDKLRRYGLAERIGSERFYPTVGTAVRAHVTDHQVDWTDWQDEAEPDGQTA